MLFEAFMNFGCIATGILTNDRFEFSRNDLEEISGMAANSNICHTFRRGRKVRCSTRVLPQFFHFQE
jgi:hypothetical protein